VNHFVFTNKAMCFVALAGPCFRPATENAEVRSGSYCSWSIMARSSSSHRRSKTIGEFVDVLKDCKMTIMVRNIDDN
jgi:hypothetical protein